MDVSVRKRRRSEGCALSSKVENSSDGEEVGSETSAPAAAATSSSTKGSGLYKPPTHEELQTLKETQNLFKSNLMKLQITELLGEVKVKKTGTSSLLDDFLHSLKEVLMGLPSSNQIDLSDGEGELKKVKFPLSFSPKNSKGKFKFGPPAGMRVVGSYLLGTSVKSDQNVDLEICLPVECLQVKDILNYRYFFKRALYLSHLASYLKKKKKSLGLASVRFKYFRGNPLCPILVLSLEEEKLSKYSVCLHTSVLDNTYFKVSKLGPDRNNVRQNFLSSDEAIPPAEEGVGLATPHYNAQLLEELGARDRHMKEIYSASQECPGLVDAIVLFKVWAKQRGIDKGYDCFSGFHFSLLAATLFQLKKISTTMSCYQIFRLLLQHICTSSWTTSGFLAPPSSALPTPSQPPLSSFHTAYEVVFVDSSGLLNVCASVSREKYWWLQHEASLALKLLDASSTQAFQALFMTPMPVEHTFDVLYSVPLSELSLSRVKLDELSRQSILLDRHAWPLPGLLCSILAVIRQGLGDRAKQIVPFLRATKEVWPTIKPPPSSRKGHVTLGLLLDTDHSFSILTMGPSSDQKEEAAKFQSFWGDRCGMRRFQDGSIKEAVVWGEGDGDKVEKKRDISEKIVSHLLERHFSIAVEGESCSRAGVLDSLLHCSDHSGARVPDGEVLMQKVCEAFMELSRDLRKLKDIPLSVTSLQGTSPTFRGTEVFSSPPWNGRLPTAMRATPPDDDHYQSACYYPSCEVATPPVVPVHPVICQLESSGRWPEDLDALRMMKVAFYINMAKGLRESKVLASPTKNYLDILKSGHVFRVKLCHHGELVQLRERLSKAPSTASAQLKLEVRDFHREMVALPVLTSTLNGLQQQFPMYGRGARLCKRWVSAHLLWNHVAEEAIDLIVARLFVHPAPFSPPSSDLLVFVRFLSLVSTFDWQQELLIVNFNDEISETRLSEVTTEFSKNRSSHPPMVLLTPHDTSQSVWTSKGTPSPPVLDRLVRLAQASLAELCSMIRGGGVSVDQDMKRLFRTPLDDFNILIHLNKRHVPSFNQGVDVSCAESSAHKAPNYVGRSTHFPVVDFDPALLYLAELKAAFSDFALFFYDKYGGSFIAVVWKPQAVAPLPFKIPSAHGRIPVANGGRQKVRKTSGEIVLDVDAIVSDFQLLGEGLVKTVQILN